MIGLHCHRMLLWSEWLKHSKPGRFKSFVPTQLVCELAGLLGVYDCVAAVERADSFDACVLRCVYVAIVACDDVCLAKRLSHQLGLVTRAMVAWAFVPDLKTKKLTSLDFDHLLHMIGSIRMLLHTRWQALAGRRRKSWAIKKTAVCAPWFASCFVWTWSVVACKPACLCKFSCCPIKVQGWLLKWRRAFCIFCVPCVSVTLVVLLAVVALGGVPCAHPCHVFTSTCMTWSLLGVLLRMPNSCVRQHIFSNM